MIHLLQNYAYGSQLSPIIDTVSIQLQHFKESFAAQLFLMYAFYVRIYVPSISR